jgi:hypothetical protein
VADVLLLGEVLRGLCGVVVASEAVDEGVGGAEHSVLNLLEDSLVVICSQSRDFLAASLDEVVEAVATGLQAFLEEPQFAFVALFLGDGHIYY